MGAGRAMGAGRRAGGKGGGQQISPAAQAFANRSRGNPAAMGRTFGAGVQRADQMGINPNLSPAVRSLAGYTGGNAAEMGRAIGGRPQVDPLPSWAQAAQQRMYDQQPLQMQDPRLRIGNLLGLGGRPQVPQDLRNVLSPDANERLAARQYGSQQRWDRSQDAYNRDLQQMQNPRRRMEAMRNQLGGGALQAPGSYMDNMPSWAQAAQQRLYDQQPSNPYVDNTTMRGIGGGWGGVPQPGGMYPGGGEVGRGPSPGGKGGGALAPSPGGFEGPLPGVRPGGASPGGKGGARRPRPGGKGGGGFQEGGPVGLGGSGGGGGNPLVGLYNYANLPAPAPTNWRGSERAPARAPMERYSGPREPAGGWGPTGPRIRPSGMFGPPPMPPIYERPVWRQGSGSPSTQTARTGYASRETPQFRFGRQSGGGPTWGVGQGYQEGGLASLLPPPGGMPPMGPGMDEMSMQMMAEGPSPMGPGMEEIGMEEISTQMPSSELGEEELVGLYMDARSALEGSHPNPEQAIAAFIEAFGEEAWIELQAMVAGGSDGMSDSIPGNIDGVEEVALSEGEYVVPSDVVSGIGNGDTNSGADRLKGMVEEIRTARTGAPGMPNQVDFEEIMGRS